MKARTLILIIAASLSLSSCGKQIWYLPKEKELHSSPYGAHLITSIDNMIIEGELLTIENKEVLLFTIRGIIHRIPVGKLNKYDLKYANSSKMSSLKKRTILLCISTISHGFFSIITLPANFIVGMTTVVSASNDYRFNEITLPKHKLFLYARFPNGIPSGIDIYSLKPKKVDKFMP